MRIKMRIMVVQRNQLPILLIPDWVDFTSLSDSFLAGPMVTSGLVEGRLLLPFLLGVLNFPGVVKVSNACKSFGIFLSEKFDPVGTPV